jgi:hypothetical protein
LFVAVEQLPLSSCRQAVIQRAGSAEPARAMKTAGPWNPARQREARARQRRESPPSEPPRWRKSRGHAHGGMLWAASAPYRRVNPPARTTGSLAMVSCEGRVGGARLHATASLGCVADSRGVPLPWPTPPHRRVNPPARTAGSLAMVSCEGRIGGARLHATASLGCAAGGLSARRCC